MTGIWGMGGFGSLLTVKRKAKRKVKRKTRKIDYNAEARAGRFYCASCGKRMPRHSSGHCMACRRLGIG